MSYHKIMKKLIKAVLFIMFLVSSAFAQQKNTGKAVISVPGAHCEYCKKRIENYVSRSYGITGIIVDLKKKTATVTWLPDRTNIEEVKTYIANVGYDADDVTAEETAYILLPKACQTKISADSTQNP